MTVCEKGYLLPNEQLTSIQRNQLIDLIRSIGPDALQSYIKELDPGSVVRENEMLRGADPGSVVREGELGARRGFGPGSVAREGEMPQQDISRLLGIDSVAREGEWDDLEQAKEAFGDRLTPELLERLKSLLLQRGFDPRSVVREGE